MIDTCLLTTALVVAGSLPLSYAIVRTPLVALLLAPLVTALISTAAVVLMVTIGLPFRFWLASTYLVSWAAAGWWLTRPRIATMSMSWRAAVATIAVLAAPFLPILHPPTAWDAHSIWWLHAGYFLFDGQVARTAMADPGFAFSHTDYPPLASAPVAAVWSLLGQGYRTAQLVSALTTFSAIAMAVVAVRTAFARTRPVLAWSAGLAVGLSTWATGGEYVAAGYADALWSVSLLGAAALLLLSPDPLRQPALALILLAAAILTKNEGLVGGGILAVLVTLRERHHISRVWMVWVPVAAGGAWVVLSRLVGSTSDIQESGPLGNLSRGGAHLNARLQPTLDAFWGNVGPLAAAAVICSVAGTLLLRHRRTELGVGSDCWLWLLNFGYTATLVLIYVTGRSDITWWLGASADRVTLPTAMLACLSAVGWLLVATSGPSGADGTRPPAVEPASPAADGGSGSAVTGRTAPVAPVSYRAQQPRKDHVAPTYQAAGA